MNVSTGLTVVTSILVAMGFTKEQRIKGLKKQLANLGESVDDGPADAVEETGRGSKTVAMMRRQQEAF